MSNGKLGEYLVLEQSSRRFHLQPGRVMVTEQTILPSPPHGVWAGNNVTVRQWQICKNGYFEDCTREEIIQLEDMLGEWNKIDFIYHPGLRLVSTEHKD